MDPQQQFCLKWNSYSSNLAMTFSNLFKSELLADVTLYCAGTIFKAHKLILAACSKNFAELFEAAPPSSSCVVILEATSAENMSALLEFMYKGEVHVSQEALNSFLKSAENLQIKGLSTEHGKLAATQAHGSHLDMGTNRRHQRCNIAPAQSPSGLNNMNNLKQECDSLMNPSSSGLSGFSPYLNQMYRPLSFDNVRKRQLRSPFTDQESPRHSGPQDGAKINSDGTAHNNKAYRPASSASTTAPMDTDAAGSERASPQSSRYDNHSPSTTGTSSNRAEIETDNDKKNNTDGHGDEKANNGAEDLRIKLEADYSQTPIANPPTPSSLASFIDTNKDGTLAAGLASSIAPADMLNVWNATKISNKGGTVNTADGKKLKCLYCDRLYGYETNLRAHIRQRHQGIRVPCPFCSRTFTRNNTVRRHIAREHKHEIAFQAGQQNNAT